LSGRREALPRRPEESDASADSVTAGVTIADALERLCRYGARPAFAIARGDQRLTIHARRSSNVAGHDGAGQRRGGPIALLALI
jgi:hypothetical protein